MTIINKKEDLIKHIREAYGEKMVHNALSAIVLDNTQNSCSATQSEKYACEDFYEGTLLEDDKAGFIKLKLSKKKIFEVLWDVYANDPAIS